MQVVYVVKILLMKDKGPLYTVVNNIIAEVVAAQGATASARLLPQYLIKYRRWAWMISIQEIVIKIFFFKYEETKKRPPPPPPRFLLSHL